MTFRLVYLINENQLALRQSSSILFLTFLQHSPPTPKAKWSYTHNIPWACLQHSTNLWDSEPLLEALYCPLLEILYRRMLEDCCGKYANLSWLWWETCPWDLEPCSGVQVVWQDAVAISHRHYATGWINLFACLCLPLFHGHDLYLANCVCLVPRRTVGTLWVLNKCLLNWCKKWVKYKHEWLEGKNIKCCRDISSI